VDQRSTGRSGNIDRKFAVNLAGIIALMTVLVSIGTPASAETRGWGIGIGALSGDFGIQGRKDIWLGGDVSQITAQGSVYFHGKTTVRLDADYHFMVTINGSSRFYPLAGIQLAFNTDDIKFGVNAGGGVNFMLTESLAAFGEIKYVFSSWDGFAFTGGIYF
jgi:hypothetical protein